MAEHIKSNGRNAATHASRDNSDKSIYYTAPTISFDDMSAREDFLLMLVSTLSGSVVQQKKQKRALTILEACGVQPEILDAADPSNALVRDELCELSGMPKGEYPQFFLVQGDKTEFFADFAELEHMNEDGTLIEWLGMEIPVQKIESESHSPGGFFEQPATKTVIPSAATKDFFYTQGVRLYDDDGTETTHPETSHAGSSFDSYSVAHPPTPLRVHHNFDRMNSSEVHYEGEEEFDAQFRQEAVDSPERKLVETAGNADAFREGKEPEEEDTLCSLLQETSPQRSHASSPRSPREDSVLFSETSPPYQEHSSIRNGAVLQRMQVVKQSPESLSSNMVEDSLFQDVVDTEHRREKVNPFEEDIPGEHPNIHSLQSLLSCDESVDTTATASSIVTNSRMTSMDLDLCIRPSTDIHFWLTHNSEDTSKCIVTLSNSSMSYLPLAFKIQASKPHQYMIWPSVGLVKPQSTVSVTVFLLDDAKQSLLESFKKLGPAAEFRCTDTLLIEWCGVPSDFCNQLTNDHDQDIETLMSYWNSCHKNEGWCCEQSYLRVRVSVDDKDQHYQHCIPKQTLCRPGTNSESEMPPHNISLRNSSSSEMDETYNILKLEIENLRRKCEEMTAERYLLEQQLEDVRERDCPSRGGAIHKFQLQQTMRCGHCLKVFRSDAKSLRAPIASQSCGHSICRNCCFGRSSSTQRRRSKHTLSSDLLMCVGDLQNLSFEDDSCPICQAPSAFGGSTLHVNESLCLVLKLLDN
ncbi:MSP major sperm protein domain containing protein [Nitzschia inconspicua]|uniref:MSP major sperm protein domain containing protein n=1 Tax=Nitzschia inconspicua TaxID=303405 RepID=A0A9K3PRM4_9STRA|nr:MSP major sperm protein domain containing protein [Nitzschia inconspicua]